MTLAERLRREGREKGREEGREEGRKEGREETALNALREGLDVKLISRLTGLSVERIEELKKNLN
ncbi:conserved hypothetical protein (putative transposase or invertase) [Thermosyntropha lipolytica DSM 11003]|uniref:Transposase n=1 Tax=Thermosyntropha lipolytica DSM 11003 TaxID=1123382 RepID=A0A1M5K1C1_9FIRM|nr:hypothetical protein [Thermosyntropha lipolytica]SHG46672.1 conserved hypothetical protein (putative transposase or invertase) [Thermosyntropha lipolytica DSM 11003]